MYIDPSTGGMLAQVLVVAFAAISGTVLLFAGKIKMFFAKMRRKDGEPAEADVEEQNEE
jgi:hypothetical protein